MKVNIIMLTRNRRKLFLQSMDTLYENTPNELYNLTVIDDQSTVEKQTAANEPPLAEALTGSTNACSLRIGHSKGITGQARNLGVYWAEKYWGRGDFLYLSDNDLYFTPRWLEKLVDAFEDPRCQPVLKLMGAWNHPFLQPTWKSGQWPDKPISVATHDAVAGASQLMRWETWDKYGPNDAHAPGVGQSEDWKFCQDIIKGGGKVGSVYPRLAFNCGVTNSLGQPSPGADEMLQELKAAKVMYPDLYWE